MNVALFIPCYIDQLYPHVGMATVEVLRQQGIEADFPSAQTCCGQPMLNAGCANDAKPLAEKFLKVFAGYDYVVCPSASCTSMVRNHYGQFLGGQPGFEKLKGSTFELCEFLVDVLKVKSIDQSFPHRVGLHQGCHGTRELRLSKSSELVEPEYNKVRSLLSTIDGISLCELKRPDECCGFGGLFSVDQEAVSCMMGLDRIADHENASAEVITSTDLSCLMHLDGLIRRNKTPIRTMHVAEILAGAKPS